MTTPREASLDEFTEQLYGQDAKERAIAILRICTLLQDSSYAQQALQRPALISLLARLLREDGKRSLDVCLCVVAFFCALSSFAQLQGHLLENQVGARTIEILSVCAQRTSLQTEPSASLSKQHTLLQLCLKLLFNLAESSTSVQRKILKKGIAQSLSDTLSCREHGVLDLAVCFLQQLSAIQEACGCIYEAGVLPRLWPLLAWPDVSLQSRVLHCLCNLVLQEDGSALVTTAMLEEVAPLLESSELRSLSLRLLYVVSCWRASRVCFLDAITTVRSLVDLLLQPAPRPDGEEQQLLLAILINISHVPAITQIMSAHHIQELADRAVQLHNALWLKLLRTLGQHQQPQHQAKFDSIIPDLAQLSQAAEKGSHVQLEAIGCLANLASLPASFDWRPTLQHLQLLPWLKQLLADKAVPQDVTMEALRLCQCLARAPVDMHIAEADMGEVLLQLLAPQQMDPVIAAQSVWVLHAMLSLPASREQMLAAHEVKATLVRLMGASDQLVQLAAAIALDVAGLV